MINFVNDSLCYLSITKTLPDLQYLGASFGFALAACFFCTYFSLAYLSREKTLEGPDLPDWLSEYES